MASPLLPRPLSLGASIGQGGVLWRSSSVADGLGGQSPAPLPLIPDGKRRVGGAHFGAAPWRQMASATSPELPRP